MQKIYIYASNKFEFIFINLNKVYEEWEWKRGTKKGCQLLFGNEKISKDDGEKRGKMEKFWPW